MKLRNKILGGLILSGALLTGCTEDRVDKPVLKDQVFSKAIINGNDKELAAKSLNKSEVEYLYAPSSVTAGRQSSFARAYWLGEERIVTMEFDEYSLNIYSIDKEKKFADNPSNKRLMMKIPVEHVDYRCADDAYGQCVGEEVKNDRITWDKKTFFRPHFEEAKITDPTFLPAGGLFDDCYSTKESKLVTASIDPDSMNFRLERAYQNNLYFYCVRGLTELEDLNWTDTTQYSFVRLDKIASPDYQKAVYNSTWINTFGFFERNDYKLDVDGNLVQDGEVKYISRWNPNRDTITYYLSPEFNKPENAVIKSATYESFKRINDSLARANVKFRLKLEEPNAAIDPVDLRNSMIVLAEDPFEASVIGYGPSLTNPRTGEIISARTVMYGGSIKKFVRYTYDEILMQIAEEKAAKSAVPAVTAPAAAATTPVAPATTRVGDQEMVVDFSPSRLAELDLPLPTNMQELMNASTNLVSRTPELTETDMEKGAEIYANRDQIAWLAKEGFYPAEVTAFGDVNQEVIADLVAAVGNLKPWETLTEIQKQSVIDVLTPYIWVPTLVHEIGHNLGLRHNFSGSEDRDNFYTNDELKAMNVPVSSKEVPYSSIMDYPKSEINALRTFGKYDVAALNFGYNLKVQDASGAWVDIDPSQDKGVTEKAYGFCSDEGIALNPNCNPFDEGKGYTEIVKSLIDSYNDRYFRGNFRRGRANFSTMDDDMYYSGVNRTFGKLRLMMELYQDLTNGWGITEEMINDQSDAATYEALAWVRDLSNAVVLSADFMMGVIQEPGMTCAISGPGLTGIQRVPIEGLGKMYFNDCFGAQLNPQFKIEGQAGKFLNSYRVLSNPNRYLDQIDVRGTWIDKAAAMRSLFRRRMGNSANDKFNGNFMDHPAVAAKLQTFVSDLLNDNYVIQDLQFKDQEGKVILSGPVGMTRSSDSYDIRAPEVPIVNWVLNVKYDKLNLVQILAQIMKNGIEQGENTIGNQRLQSALAINVATSNSPTGCDASSCSVKIGSKVYYTDAGSNISYGLLQKINNGRLYESVTPQQLQDVYVLFVTGKPAPADPAMAAIYNAGRPALEAYLRGARTPSTFFENIVTSLAGQNTFR